ncbi:MAG: Ig-like domain-containing protein [Candidatus Methanomethylophilaceae archaeon]|nr:Ig-like domain-containing protein [Candidatus Methanomethylophilaceae archaeon]
MEKNKMIAIIVVAIAIIAAIAAAVVLTSGNGNDSKDVKVNGVVLNPATLSLEEGGQGKLTVTVSPSNATNKNVTWSTSNASVATVSNGVVTAKSQGTATITVTTVDGKLATTCDVTVVGSSVVPVTGIALDKRTMDLEKGQTGTIVATVMPDNATNKTINWSTKDSSVATVSNGVVTAVGAGTTDIAATSADGKVTTLCHVTVTSPVEVSTMDEAILKVYGNVNGDKVIDAKDVAIIQSLIAAGAKATDANKMADANNDGAIDAKDVAAVNKIIAREPTTIWHINYHDQDSNGTMDEILVETQFPISSVIMTGSSNSFLLMWMLGIVDEVKGACYSTTVDTYFSDTYLNTDKVKKLGSKSYEIPLEDGKAGSSNIIAEENVTAVITDWNRTYISNWQSYEAMGVDVVRVAAASVETDVFSHGALLLGLLFGKVDRAVELVDFYNNIYAQIDAKLYNVAEADKPGFVASSTTGSLSVGSSDYNKVGTMAGGRYALDGLDSQGSSSVKIADYPQIYNTQLYNFDYILHLRTGNFYAGTVDADKLWNDYTSPFSDWEKGTEGQYIICGGMPVPLRAAYALTVLHPELASVEWANGLHQQLVDKFFNGDKLDIASMDFIIHKGEGDSSTAQLMILGNANDDDTIDSKDLKIVNDIIAGSKKLSDFPMADVNNDGKVDSADVDLLNKIIKRESTTLYVACLGVDGKETVVEVKYPLRNVVTYATNMQMPALFANGGQYIAGYFASSYDVAESSISASAVDLKGNQRQITDEAWANFTALDAKLASQGGIGAVLVDHSGIAQFTESRMADLKASGIPMIDYTSADAVDELQTVLTLGFLFGGDCEKVGRDYAKLGWDVKEKVQSEVSKMSSSDLVSYICGTMYIYVCGPDSSFNTTAATAGGVPYSTLNADFASKYTKNSTKMSSTEALSNYTDAGIFINNRSMDWGLTAAEKADLIKDTWDHSNSGVSSREYFKDFEDKLVYVDNLLPGGVKIAYMAHAMYGDTFTREWADGVLQSYIDCGTLPLAGQTLDTVLAYITFDDFKAVSN